jgi:Tfp pilus assembly protein PilF
MIRSTLVRMLATALALAAVARVLGRPPDPRTLSEDRLRDLRRANIRVERGNEFMRQGLQRSAEREYSAALKLFPDHVDALYNLAIVYEKTERKDKARETYEQMLRVHPGSAAARTSLGDLYADAGDVIRAEGLYRDAIDANPRFGRAYNNLGFLLQRQGRHEEAVEAFGTFAEQELAKEKPDPFAFYNLGCALLEAGEPSRAKEWLLRAVDILPDDHLVNNALGNVYVVQKLHTQALLRFRRAQQAAPGYAPVWEGLGDVHAARNEPDKAIEMYREALRLRPDYPGVHFKLGGLLEGRDPAGALLHFREYLRYGTVPSLKKQAEEACRRLEGNGS